MTVQPRNPAQLLSNAVSLFRHTCLNTPSHTSKQASIGAASALASASHRNHIFPSNFIFRIAQVPTSRRCRRRCRRRVGALRCVKCEHDPSTSSMSDLPTRHHPRPPCYPSKDPLLLKQIQMSIRRNIFLVYFLPRDHLAKTEIVENANLWIFFVVSVQTSQL